MISNNLYRKYNNVHRRSFVDSRELWSFILSTWEITSALELLVDMLEEEEVSIETVEDLIPEGWTYTRDLVFLISRNTFTLNQSDLPTFEVPLLRRSLPCLSLKV